MKQFGMYFFAILMFGLSSAFAETGSHGVEPGDLDYLESSAIAGNEKAQMKLAIMYLQGNGVAADFDKAIFYYRLAAESGVAFAQYKLARLYLDGDYTEPAPGQALAWLSRAARHGLVQAQLDLSLLYQEGSVASPRDYVQAHKWLIIASSLSDADFGPAREELEGRMTFLELARANLLSRICILNDYQGC